MVDDFYSDLGLRPLRINVVPHPSQQSYVPPSYQKRHSDTTDEQMIALTVAKRKLAKFEVIALEAGIVFHSIIIGVTLGADSGPGWIVRQKKKKERKIN